MIDTENIEELMIDDWYKMNRHDWKYVCKEHKDLLAEVKRLNNIISTFDEFMCKLPQRYTEGTMRLWNKLVNKHYGDEEE